MSKIAKYIDLIVNGENEEYMNKLKDILVDSLEELKEYNCNKYREFKDELYGMAYDYKIDKEMALELVENMSNGEIWDMATTTNVKNQYGLTNIDEDDFYVVMNSLANDYKDVIPTSNAETYVKLAKAWILDDDANDNKVWIYFHKIPKQE